MNELNVTVKLTWKLVEWISIWLHQMFFAQNAKENLKIPANSIDYIALRLSKL